MAQSPKAGQQASDAQVKQAQVKQALGLMALEPRILLDAAAVATGAEVLDDTQQQDIAASDDAPLSAEVEALAAGLMEGVSESRVEIVFVDPSVPDLETLLADLDENAQVIYLDPDRDGVEQIAEHLENRVEIDAVHIVSHGDPGRLQLGSATLDLASIQGDHADELSTIGAALSEGGDILIYGCDFGGDESGQLAVDALAEATGADIAASSDTTGHESLGGDWELETTIGSIEAEIVIDLETQGTWTHTLDTVQFQQGSNGYTGTSDTELDRLSGSTSFGSATTLRVDDGSPNDEQILIKFDDIFGNGAGQIAYGSTITSASLKFYVSGTDAGETVQVHRMLTNWTESSTYNSLNNGVSANGTEAAVAASGTLDAGLGGTQIISGLEADVQAWLDGANNYGWVIDTGSTGAIDWEVYSSENSTAGARPILEVTFTPPAPQAPDIVVPFEDFDGVAGEQIVIPVDTQFSDVNGDTLTFSVSGLPSGLSYNAVSGQIEGSLPADAATAGPYTVTITADDGTGFTTDAVFTISGHDPATGSLSGSWSVNTSTDVATTTLGNGVGVTVSGTAGSGGAFEINSTTTLTSNAVYGDAAVQGATALDMGFYWDMTPEGSGDAASDDAASGTMTITFSEDVVDPILYFDRIGGHGNYISNSADFTVLTAGITLEEISGNKQFEVDEGAGSIERTVGTTLNTSAGTASTHDPLEGTSAGAVRLKGTFSTVTFQIDPASGSIEGAGGDGFSLAIQVNAAPDATDDTATAQPGSAVNVDVLANDSDAEGDAMAVSAIVDPFDASETAISVGSPVTLNSGTVVALNADGTLDVTLASGTWPEESFSYIVTDTFGGRGTGSVTVQVDVDGDGLGGLADKDSDGDGILDRNEYRILTTGEIQWLHNDAGGTTNAATFSGDGASFTSSTSDITFGSGFTAPTSNSEYILSGSDATTYAEAVAYNEYVEVSFTLSQTSSLDFLWHGLAATEWGASGAGDYSMTGLLSSDGFATSDVLFSDATQASPAPNSYAYTQHDTPGTILEAGTTYSLRVYLYDEQNSYSPDNTLAFDDLSLYLTAIDPLDTDSDGVADHLDLDSDNDGITDNVEAQSTAGYVAPSGVDADADGLDDVYEGAGDAGLTPVDTDGDGTADYLDADSDDDGILDIAERGDGADFAIGGDFTDSDGDGLLDLFEGADVADGYDANDENITGGGAFALSADPGLASDGSNADPLTLDLDFRDADTDNDGIANPLDLDDDDDGLLDLVETQSAVLTYEFYDLAIVDGSVENVPGLGATATGTIGDFDVDTIWTTHTPADGDYFAIRYTGYITVSESGTHEFSTGSDDASQLYVNGQLVVDNDYLQGFTTRTGTIDLDRGTYTFEVRFYEHGGGEELAVGYRAPSAGALADLPFSMLSTDRDTDGDGAADHLDTDSDNDGVGDLFEAQTLVGYVAPTGLDSDNDGLDDAFESGGLTAVDTDGDGTADYLDLDSDDDGLTDAQELADATRASGLSGSQSFTATIDSLDPASEAEDHILQSITVGGRTYSDFALPDAFESSFSNPSGAAFRDDGSQVFTAASNASFDTDILGAFQGLDLGAYLAIDGALTTDDHYILRYNTPVVAGRDMFIAFTERNGNNAAVIEALDADGNVIGTLTVNTSDYTDLGHLIEASGNQNAHMAVYALDDLASVGSEIHALKVSFAGSTNDGPDGKVLIFGGETALTGAHGFDTDGDGITNARDLDSDGDGIADAAEGFSTSIANFTSLLGSANALEPGDTAVVTSTAVGGDALGTNVTISAPVEIGTITGAKIFSAAASDTADILRLETGSTDLGEGFSTSMTFDSASMLTISADNTVAPSNLNSSDQLQFTAINAPEGFEWKVLSSADASITVDGAQITITGTSGFAGSQPFAEFEIFANMPIDGVDIVFETMDPSGLSINSSQFRFGLTEVSDTDSDGVADYLDLDSDNDGITDNVEAQATASYTAPSGVDADSDGIDDAYGAGLTPVDTDGDGTADYLDADSDGDGIADIAERGDGAPSSITDTTDTDGDGLLDIFEGADAVDDFDANDENIDGSGDFALARSVIVSADGSDADPSTADLKFRDVNSAPVIDLAGTGVSSSNVVAMTEGDDYVLIAQTTGDLSDVEGEIASLTVSWTGFADGTDETILIGGNALDLSTTASYQVKVSDSLIVDVAVDASAERLTITHDTRSYLTNDEAQALVRSLAYRNLSQDPTETDRGFIFDAVDLDGASAASVTSVVTISAVNDAPILDLDATSVAESVSVSPSEVLAFSGGDVGVDRTQSFTFDLDSDMLLSTAQVTISLETIDNSFQVTLNGETLSYNGIELEFQPAGQALLKFADDTKLVEPSVANANDLPRLEVRITESGTEFWATRDSSATVLEQVFPVTGSINLVALTTGTNTLDFTLFDSSSTESAVGEIFVSAERSGHTISYTENAAALEVVSSDVAITEPEGGTLQSADVTLSGAVTGDRLLVGGSAAASGTTAQGLSWTRTDSAVSFTGAGSAADYEAALQLVQFESTSDTPTNAQRTASVWVSDGTDSSAVALSVINVTPVDDTAVVDLNGASAGTDHAVTFTENGGAVAIAAADASIDEFGEDDLSALTVQLSGALATETDAVFAFGAGSFSYGTSATQTVTFGATTFQIDYDGDAEFAVMNAAGGGTAMPRADLEALLQAATFENTSENPTEGTLTIEVFVQDQGGLISAVASTDVTVVAVNDAPTLDLNGAGAGADHAVSFTEGDAGIAIMPDAIVADVDSTVPTVFIDVDTLPEGDDEYLTIAGQVVPLETGATFTTSILGVSFDIDIELGEMRIDETVPGTSTPAVMQALLRSITYTNASEAPTAGDRTITVLLRDGEGLNGTLRSTVVSVTPVNDAPVGADDSISLAEDTVHSGTLPVATDVDGDALT
ncbi:MAG: DUF4347 domain-containing protein, partial [Neomegalonema sp.]|nr:DUF4347 domain-containing protein [Neomegalonema sp.]